MSFLFLKTTTIPIKLFIGGTILLFKQCGIIDNHWEKVPVTVLIVKNQSQGLNPTNKLLPNKLICHKNGPWLMLSFYFSPKIKYEYK